MNINYMDNGVKTCPRVCECVADPGKILIKDRAITIRFTYPLEKAVEFKFKSQRGFTAAKVWECVYTGYQKIYKNEKKYGIWGHDIGDLVLESITKGGDGVYNLGIGS